MLEALGHHENVATSAEIRTHVVGTLGIVDLVANYEYSIKLDLDPPD